MDGSSLLIVDDDAGIRDALGQYLGRQGYRVHAVESAAAMDRVLLGKGVDLVVLDIMMPGEDGLSVAGRLRRSGLPILMISARGDTTDRIVGLEVGADDYLAKPFDPRELLARVRALLRRKGPDDVGETVFCFCGWRFAPDQRRLSTPAGGSVPLSGGEASLLRAFVERPRRLLSREMLLDLAWGVSAFDRAVDLQVSRLRRKLAEHDAGPLIETVRGEGYRFLAAVRRSG